MHSSSAVLCVLCVLCRYYGAVTAGVIILYFVFTFSTTDWRDKYRRVMNEKGTQQRAQPRTKHAHAAI